MTVILLLIPSGGWYEYWFIKRCLVLATLASGFGDKDVTATIELAQPPAEVDTVFSSSPYDRDVDKWMVRIGVTWQKFQWRQDSPAVPCVTCPGECEEICRSGYSNAIGRNSMRWRVSDVVMGVKIQESEGDGPQ